MGPRTKNSRTVKPLIINGLKGRVLSVPTTKKTSKREILLIYGHHASIERMLGIAENMAEYGNVTMPDLPGFGGMDSFYKIGEKPNLDKLADYLATFIKLKYKKRHLTIGAMSFGFEITTRMLQKYPELCKQVDLLVSLVGFSKYSDFKFKSRNLLTFKIVSRCFSFYLPSLFLKYIVLRGPIIRLSYYSVADKHVKMKDASKEERNERIKFEIVLWQCNDIRTYMYTGHTMLTSDLTRYSVDVPVAHVSVNGDQYFNNAQVAKNLKKIYKKVDVYKAKMPNHAPTVISEATEAAEFMPMPLRRLLERSPNK